MQIIYVIQQDFMKMFSRLKPIISLHYPFKYYSRELFTKTTLKNGIKNITMDNQKTRNSLSIPMMKELIKNIREHENSKDLRVIILGGEGPVFSAGHNLKELVRELKSNLINILLSIFNCRPKKVENSNKKKFLK